MAKYSASSNKKVVNKYPSDHGSHKTMMVTTEAFAKYNEDPDIDIAFCEDDRGIYVTTKDKMDNGLCDYNRAQTLELRLELREFWIKALEEGIIDEEKQEKEE